MKRLGFTLLEVMVAIVLAGVVALLVYGAAQAGADTRARVASEERRLLSAVAMRVLLEDALRNAYPGRRPGEATFSLTAAAGPDGRPADRLSFVTAGGSAPLTPETDWLVTLEPVATGLALTGVPLGVRAAQPVTAVLPGARGLQVRFRAAGDTTWLAAWPRGPIVPQAVELTYWRDSAATAVPLRLELPLGAGR